MRQYGHHVVTTVGSALLAQRSPRSEVFTNSYYATPQDAKTLSSPSTPAPSRGNQTNCPCRGAQLQCEGVHLNKQLCFLNTKQNGEMEGFSPSLVGSPIHVSLSAAILIEKIVLLNRGSMLQAPAFHTNKILTNLFVILLNL